MTAKTIEAIYGVPDDDPVVQIFEAGNGPQIGEISVLDGKLVLRVFHHMDCQISSISIDELQQVIGLARERLLETDT